MNVALVTAMVAATAHGGAALSQRRVAQWLAVVATVAALAARAPAVGAAVTGLAAALGIAAVAVRLEIARLHWPAALFAVPAAVFAAAPPAPGALPMASAALGILLCASGVAAIVLVVAHGGSLVRVGAALVVVLAPAPLSIVTPLAGLAELPLGAAPAATLHRGTVLLDLATAPAWAVAGWRGAPWLFAIAALVGWARGARATVIGFSIVAAALVAFAATCWPSLAAHLGPTASIVTDPRHFGLATTVIPGQLQLDGAAALLTLIRGAAGAALLIAPLKIEPTHGSSIAIADGIVLALSLVAVGVWAVLAPPLVGPHWHSDPAALAVMAAALSSLFLLRWPRSDASLLLRAVQFAGCGVVLGGGDLGWRVASVLLSA